MHLIFFELHHNLLSICLTTSPTVTNSSPASVVAASVGLIQTCLLLGGCLFVCVFCLCFTKNDHSKSHGMIAVRLNP